jgi:hypothetical protein
MSPGSSSNQLLDPVLLGSWIFQRSHIWQMNLLTAKKLAEFATKHGLSSYREEYINHLWKLGLLRADLIVSSQEIDEAGLVFVGQEEDTFLYADARLPQPFQDTSSVPLEEAQAVSPLLTIFFHPFRFAVLQSLGLLVPSITPVQMLYPQLYRVQEVMALMQRTLQPAQSNFLGTQYWNDVASLLVATEPCFYQQIYQHLHLHLSQTRPTPRGWTQGDDPGTIFDIGFKELRDEINQHWNDVANHYRTLDVDRLKQLHHDLCIRTRMLDSNTEAHTILRLGNEHLRLNLEGSLGGAMLLRTMAEVLRLAIEEVFHIQLQEEDGWFDHAKEKVYGSKRLFDGDRNAANEFLRQHGLGYGPRLRWYVEGDTEFRGLNDFFRTIGATDIEILNLRGQIVQKNGLSFRESLRSDIRMGIFSFVSLDADVSKNLQALRTAAQKDQICGCFFVSRPDFEFANFDLSELQEIVWDTALERGADETKKSIFIAATSGAKTGKIFFGGVEKAASEIPELWNKAKGEEWGERLVQYMLSHPDRLNGEVRLYIKAIRLAFNARTASYNYTRLYYHVNPETGESVKRDIPMTSQERLQEI